MTFTAAQIERYARQIVLPEIGGEGQARLGRAKVLVVGAGGLGSPAALYLAAAGIGTLGICDDDLVDLSNLQRQILHSARTVGRLKTDSAREALARINPETVVVAHETRLTASNAGGVVGFYDLVLDGSDNQKTRRAVHDACYRARVPLVSGSALGLDGQLSTFKAYLGEPHPSYACVFPDDAPADALPSCAQAGVLSPVCGVIGSLMAVEAIKEALEIGESLSGTLLMYDALGGGFHRVRVRRRAANPLFALPAEA